MKACTNPELGNLIALYEFDKLSQEDRDLFEEHLLECDACYQDLYEFSPAVETMKENIKAFRKAVAPERSILQWLLERSAIISQAARRLFWEPLQPLPQFLRPAIPVLVMAVVVFFIVQIAKVDNEPANLAIDKPTVQQSEGQRIVLHEPEVMEAKGSSEIKSGLDGGVQDLSTSHFETKLAESMKAMKSQDNERIIFSWLQTDSIKVVNIYLIGAGKRVQITPMEGIKGNQFSYPAKELDKATTYTWELAGELLSRKTFRVQKALSPYRIKLEHVIPKESSRDRARSRFGKPVH